VAQGRAVLVADWLVVVSWDVPCMSARRAALRESCDSSAHWVRAEVRLDPYRSCSVSEAGIQSRFNPRLARIGFGNLGQWPGTAGRHGRIAMNTSRTALIGSLLNAALATGGALALASPAAAGMGGGDGYYGGEYGGDDGDHHEGNDDWRWRHHGGGHGVWRIWRLAVASPRPLPGTSDLCRAVLLHEGDPLF
jgi:hypothetical protein